MCLIVDANVSAELLGRPSRVVDWLLSKGRNPRLVASGPLRRELAKTQEVLRVLVRLEQAGRLRKVDEAQVEEKSARLRRSGNLASNDPHVIALAIVSGARTLATRDEPLTRDFTNKALIDKPRGRVYRDPDMHGHLLRHTSSCGIR